MKDAIPYASLQICCARRAAPRHRTNAERETQYQRHGAKHGKKQYANRYPKFFFSRAHTARPLALTTTYSAAGSFGWAACLAGISWNVFDGGRRSAWSRWTKPDSAQQHLIPTFVTARIWAGRGRFKLIRVRPQPRESKAHGCQPPLLMERRQRRAGEILVPRLNFTLVFVCVRHKENNKRW